MGLRRVDLPMPGMTQESVSAQRDRARWVMWCTPAGKFIYLNHRDPRFQDDPELYLDLMTTRTGYLIKHTLPSARYNPVIALSKVDEERIVG